MTIRLLRRYIVKKSSRILAVAGVLLFVFQTGPVYCGACIPGNCGHGESAFRLAGNDDCHKAVQTNECCKNKPEKKLRDGEYGVDDCTSCDCSFKVGTENQTSVVLNSSKPSTDLFIFRLLDNFDTFFHPAQYPHRIIYKSEVQCTPIFVLNSTFLI